MIAFLFVCLAFFAVNATAQISVGPTGAGPLTFDTAPPATDFSSYVLTGVGTTYSDLATLDAGVATLDASVIINPLIVVAEATPGQFAGVMRYNSQLQLIQTRPTTGGTNAAAVMLGKFVNNSGQDRSSAIISYSQVTRSSIAGGHLYGMSVYWSLTGAPGSWTSIPELNTEFTGDLLGALTLGNWAQGSTLYILWVDDNSDAITDPSYTIDNLSLVFSVDAPVITSQPRSTNVTVAQTIRLSVVATGLGLTYQWFHDGVPIDGGVNPTAAQATLVINNAQFADAGEYRVTVNNPGGGAISDIANVLIGDDHAPPRMLFFSQIAGNPRGFRLVVNEPLCESACLADATFVFNWIFSEVGGIPIIPESIASSSGTNYDFTLPSDFVLNPTGLYYVTPDPNGPGIVDLFNNLMTNLPPAAPDYQSITSSPVRIFNTDIADAELHSNAGADLTLGTAASITVDNDDAGIAHALLRFNNLIGSGATQIPSGAVIIDATLSINQTDPGSAANMHRMLITWDQATVTWNTMVDGVANDGVEAVVASDALTPENAANGIVTINVTASVQAWADGQANFGWVFRSTGTGGWDWDSSEGTTPPSLAVTYTVPPCTTTPAFTSHPAGATPVEGGSFTLTAGVSGACNASYQWTKDNVDIPGATGSSYTVASAIAGLGGSSGSYRLRVTNPQGSVTSNPALVTVTPDTVRPVVLRVGNSNATTLVVFFSKVMGATAAVPGNYTLNGVAASSAVLSTDGRSVTLTTDARTFPTTYSLSIANVSDNRATPNVINPNPTVVPITTVSVINAWGGAWQYNTNDQVATPTWTSVPTASLDATWLTGNELFGTETSGGVVALFPVPIGTPLPPNTNTPPDMVTFYFRRDITLPALPAGTTYAINHLIDDGAVFYLDGVEIGRLNMVAAPAPVAYSTKALTAGEAVFSSLAFSASAGAHVLAVEVHQGGATTSSDMLFGAQVIALPTASPSLTISLVGANAEVRWSADTKWSLIGSATSVTGPYTPVALPAGNPLGFYSTPATQTNQFYRLLYIGP